MINKRRAPESVQLTADLVLFTLKDGKDKELSDFPGVQPGVVELCVLVITRLTEPFAGRYALPGGFVRPEESLEDAAVRELEEETGIKLPEGLEFEQVKVYSEPDRDPRRRVVTCSFFAIVPDLPKPKAGTDAATVRWVPVRSIDWLALAFDHELIVQDALRRARETLQFTSIATRFCDEAFTIKELREVYEVVWGVALDGPNFHRKVAESSGFVEPTGGTKPTRGRPAALFRAGGAVVLEHPIMMPGHLR